GNIVKTKNRNGPGVTQGKGFITPLKGWVGGYYDGLFETLDGGITWDTLNFGRTFNRFFVLDSNHVYAAGRSVYRYGDSVNFTVTKDIARANPHKLYPVSPNPTTGKLNIKFDIGEYSNVMLQIVSLDAKKVFTV